MKSKVIPNTTGVLLAFFGIITLIASSAVIFDLFGMREKEGNYVLFVIIANFVCSFLYLFAAYGFFKRKLWTSMILNIAVVLLIITFVALGAHIYLGGVFEDKTIYALIFRTLVTLGFLFMATKYLPKKPSEN